jgi:putative ABC transport system ATP-binding protein
MEDPRADAVVQLESVRKRYGSERTGVVALDGVTLDFERTSFTAIIGPSGSGTSTLLQIWIYLSVIATATMLTLLATLFPTALVLRARPVEAAASG